MAAILALIDNFLPAFFALTDFLPAALALTAFFLPLPF